MSSQDYMQVGNISIAEIVAQTKHLEITARKLVNDSLQSDYKSSFRGRGMEFDEVRAYSFGDDVRDIDWNVTARMNEPFIKTFIEERRLTTFFLTDISESQASGAKKSKRTLMAEITALLGFTSFFANDNTGLVMFSDNIEKIIPAKHSHPNLLRIIRDVYYYQGKSKKTCLDKALRGAASMLKKKAVIFLLSDFFDSDYEQALGILSKKHEVIPLVLLDKNEEKFSFPSFQPIISSLEDMESGQSQLVSLSGKSITSLKTTQTRYRTIFKKLGLHYAEIFLDSPYLTVIDKVLKRHGNLR